MKYTDRIVERWLLRGARGVSAACALLAVGLLLPGCGEGDGPLQVTQRVAKRSSIPVRKASSADRFLPPRSRAQHGGDGLASNPEDRGTLPFIWDVPDGWAEVPPRSKLRVVDFRIDDDPAAECYLVAMRGDGGGLLANVNRWRQQLEQGPLAEANLVQLPKYKLLGSDAPFIEVSGDYTNMNAPVVKGAKLLGLIHSLPEFTLFAKLTGPAAVVDAQRESFLEFCASLNVATREQAPGKPAGGKAARGPVGDWDVPSDWTMTAPKPMRQVNFQLKDGGECYVTVLGGAGGGTLANVNRWLGQIGKPPLDAAGLAALPRITMLGREAQLVEGSGDFEGMGSASKANQGLLGAMVELPGRAVFVKMVGPAAVVQDQRDAFLAFAEALREEDL